MPAKKNKSKSKVGKPTKVIPNSKYDWREKEEQIFKIIRNNANLSRIKIALALGYEGKEAENAGRALSSYLDYNYKGKAGFMKSLAKVVPPVELTLDDVVVEKPIIEEPVVVHKDEAPPVMIEEATKFVVGSEFGAKTKLMRTHKKLIIEAHQRGETYEKIADMFEGLKDFNVRGFLKDEGIVKSTKSRRINFRQHYVSIASKLRKRFTYTEIERGIGCGASLGQHLNRVYGGREGFLNWFEDHKEELLAERNGLDILPPEGAPKVEEPPVVEEPVTEHFQAKKLDLVQCEILISLMKSHVCPNKYDELETIAIATSLRVNEVYS